MYTSMCASTMCVCVHDVVWCVDNGKLCMIYDHELDVTLGPFPIGEWSMFVPVHYYNRVVPW